MPLICVIGGPLADQFLFSSFFVSGAGRFYAVQSERSIHHGGAGEQFPIHHWWSRFHYNGPSACTGQSQVKSNSVDVDGILIHSGVVLHHVDFHAHEIAGILATIEASRSIFLMNSQALIRFTN